MCRYLLFIRKILEGLERLVFPRIADFPQYAASFGLVDVVRLILLTEKDSDIDALGGRARSSALHVAVYRDHIEVVKVLLERGADPNLCNERMEPPLYWARTHEMKQLLLKHGALRGGRKIFG